MANAKQLIEDVSEARLGPAAVAEYQRQYGRVPEEDRPEEPEPSLSAEGLVRKLIGEQSEKDMINKLIMKHKGQLGDSKYSLTAIFDSSGQADGWISAMEKANLGSIKSSPKRQGSKYVVNYKVGR